MPCGQAYAKAGIKPIFGCEFYICDDITTKDPIQPSLRYKCLPHITILAQTQEGYGNLLKLSRLSYEEGFYGKPRIDHRLLIENQKGLVVLSGCPGGYPTRHLETNGYDFLKTYLLWMKSNVEYYFIELTPQPGWDTSIRTLPLLWQASSELGIPTVATADCHFPLPSDHMAQDALLAVGLKSTIDDPKRELRLPAYQYYCSAEELRQRLFDVCPQIQNWSYEAVNNSFLIGETCNVELVKAKSVAFPDLPEGKTSADVLWEWVREGAHKRHLQGLLSAENFPLYIARASHEFCVLKEKGFCDYILAIADVIRWMKSHDGLVMTRGSAGGSLLLWLLGSSETDPIALDLSFERFYDATRTDPPDVDIDFEQTRRDEAVEYIYNKYGRANCSQIAALSRLGPKGAVQDTGSALGMHRSVYGCISDVINDKDMDIDRNLAAITDPKARKLIDGNPTLVYLIKGMCGQYRHSSVHAAGVLISSEPLDKVIGVIFNGGKPIAAVDKYGAASLGFLKIDMLCVQALDVIGLTARKVHGSVDWLYQLPRNNPKVYEIAKQGKLAGIFQLDGATAKRALNTIGADTFEDLVAASVLCRPGCEPFIPVYKKHKFNPLDFQEFLTSTNPIAANILYKTFGVLMYQEQVMRMAAEMAGLEEVYVHRLRKDVGNKVGLDPQKGDAWRAEWYQRFVGGAMQHIGISQKEAEHWWSTVQLHGSYSFNKSHATTYGIIGYWMLYLKAFHSAQFYEAYLQLEKDDIVKKRLVHEFRQSGGTVKVLDPVHSGDSFQSIGINTLVGGYSDLKFIGPALAKKMVQFAPFPDMATCMHAIPKRTRDLLIKAGIETGEWDPQILIQVAPWMPVPALAPQDQVIKQQYNIRGIGGMPDHAIDGNVMMCGYVTLTKFDKDRLILILEDHDAMATCRVAGNRMKTLGSKVRELSEGDFVAINGWWAGDVLFINDYAMLRKRELK